MKPVLNVAKLTHLWSLLLLLAATAIAGGEDLPLHDGAAPLPAQTAGLFPKPAFELDRQHAKAGETVRFSLRFKDIKASSIKSKGLIIRLSLGPERPYFYQEIDLDSSSDTQAAEPSLLGPFSLTLPDDLPAGVYSVEAALIGQPYSGSDPRDLVAGTVQIDAAEKAPAFPRKVLASGTYVDSTGVPHLWASSPEHSLYWDGAPFMPISAMLGGPFLGLAGPKTDATFAEFQKQIEILLSHGLNHIYLFTASTMERLKPAEWQRVFDYLDSVGMTYVVGFPTGSLPRPSEESHVPVRPIRVAAGLQLKASAQLPGEASRVLKSSELGFPLDAQSIASCQAIAVDGAGQIYGPVDCSVHPIDKLQAEVKADFAALPNNDYDVFFLPEMRVPCGAMGSPWVDPAGEAAKICSYLSQIRFGPGFRGFIDLAIKNEHGINNKYESLFLLVPDFLKQRAEWLQRTYGTVDALAKAWLVSSGEIESFDQAARLYPAVMFSRGEKGQSLVLIDGVTEKLVSLDGRATPFWLEYLAERDASMAVAQEQIRDGVRDLIDVPVIYKRVGYTRTYNANLNLTNRGADGVGYELYAVKDSLVGYGAGCGYAEILESGKSMIGAVTEMGEGYSNDMNANWPDLPSFVQDMVVSMFFDAKMANLFLFDVLPKSIYPRNRLLHDSRMLEWMALWQEIVAAHAPGVVAHVPEVYTSWPGPDAWWAKPSERRAVNGIDDAPGIIPAKAPNNIWVIPVNEATAPAPVTFVTLADDPEVSWRAHDFEQLLARKDRIVVFLGLRKNLGKLSIDSYFTNETFTEDGSLFQRLAPTPTSRILHQDGQGRVWALQDGNLQIVARQPVNGGTQESTLAYADLPQPSDPAKASWERFLSDTLGVQLLSAGNGLLRGVAFQEGTVPVVAMHTTTRTGGETVQVSSKSNQPFRLKQPESEEWTAVGAGEKAKFTFPPGPGDDLNQGAGLGLVRIEGVPANDLQWEVAGGGDGKAAEVPENSPLPPGVVLPEIQLPETFVTANIDEDRAEAGLRDAATAYEHDELDDAWRLLKQWDNGATKQMLLSFYQLEGAVLLKEGRAREAEATLRKAQQANPDDVIIAHELGLSLVAQGKTDEGFRQIGVAAKDTGIQGDAARHDLKILRP